jgi:TRAP-type C4-dicarboxylate transport system permease small subunit
MVVVAGICNNDRNKKGGDMSETSVASAGPTSMSERIALKFASFLNILSAIWLSCLALLILYDVVGREAFGSPLYGTNEIVANSVLSILFLQLPLSILDRRSLRTTITYGVLGTRGKGFVDAASYFFGACLFLAIAFGGWNFMIEAWEIGEVEGSGIVTIPVYPIRTLVVAIGAIGTLICLMMSWHALVDPETIVEHD